LEKIFEVTGIKPAAEKCAAMEGILKKVTNSSAKLMWVFATPVSLHQNKSKTL
jgi:ferritin-like metal-binding protein YciE